jgi:hypothetical protein
MQLSICGSYADASDHAVFSAAVNNRDNMKVVLCNDGVCVPPKCPVVHIQGDKVIIGEKKNMCTLTREQFDILRRKIINGEI